ncbi:hypothetical protein HAX54_047876 [Datura stramonium]|uniref:Uncharacterized protein n=1 Tax=Datura stramonium TaxID=4076 RepID=A0ABS8SUJ3_DATST|nr:hypothetical protein [Datura stramonium]
MAESEENSSKRHANEGSVAQEERTRSENYTEEEKGARDDFFKSNEDGGDMKEFAIITCLNYHLPEKYAEEKMSPEIVQSRILPTPSEIKMNFLTGFVPFQVTRDDKIKKLERDLVEMVAIKKDCRVVVKDIVPSRVLVEFGVVGCDATIINHDGVGIGEFSPNFGVGDGGGRYSPNVGGGGGEIFSPINEEFRCPSETPFTVGETSFVGASTSKIKRQHVDGYKRINSQKTMNIKDMLKHKSEIKKLYTMHRFNYVYFDIMLDMDKWWEDYQQLQTTTTTSEMSTSSCSCLQQLLQATVANNNYSCLQQLLQKVQQLL